MQHDRFFEHHFDASRAAPAKKKGMLAATLSAWLAALRDAVTGSPTTKKETTVQWSSAPASPTAPSKGDRSKGTSLFSRKSQEKGEEKEKELSKDDKRARTRRAEVQSWFPTEWVSSDKGTDLARSPSTDRPPRDVSLETERHSSLSGQRTTILKHKSSDLPSSTGGSESHPGTSPAMQKPSLHARTDEEEAELSAVLESVSWSPEKRPSHGRRGSKVLSEEDTTDLPSRRQKCPSSGPLSIPLLSFPTLQAAA